MKSKLFVMGCILLVAAGVQAELIVNGGFETTGGWDSIGTYSHTTSVYYQGPAPADSGEYYYCSITGRGATLETSTQTVDVSGLVGETYMLSAWFAGYSDGDTGQIELEFFDAGGSSLGIGSFLDGETGGLDGETQTWDQFVDYGVIPTGAVTADVRILQAGAGNGNDNYTDNVSMTIVPEPATMALLGLGAFVLRRRKN